MNRTSNLISAINSWLPHKVIKEIIIVDWSSENPCATDVLKAGVDDPRIKHVRVEGEEKWVLSFAYNLGADIARYPRLLKLDADYVLSQDFFLVNKLGSLSFRAGNWRRATKENKYINGALYCWRDHFISVGGYNENIRDYGWDDSDLYDRLSYAGLKREDIHPASIQHLTHADKERVGRSPSRARNAYQEIAHEPKWSITVNMFMCLLMRSWSINSARQRYKLIDVEVPGIAMQRLPSTPSPRLLKLKDIATALLVREVLRDYTFTNNQLPSVEELLRKIPTNTTAEIAESLTENTGNDHAQLLISAPRKKLFLILNSGLASRLQSLASAQLIAKACNRELVVVWETNNHCSAKLDELIDYSGPIIKSEPHSVEFDDLTIRYDLGVSRGGLEHRRRLHFFSDLDYSILARGVIKHPSVNLQGIRSWLGALRLSNQVKELVDEITSQHVFSVHLRETIYNSNKSCTKSFNEVSKIFPIEANIKVGNKNCPKAFFRRIDRQLLTVKNQDRKFFLATDSSLLRFWVHSRYEKQVVDFGRFDRGFEVSDTGIKAMADLILLSRSKQGLIIGSSQSNFTLTASLLSWRPSAVEIYGKNF